MKNMLSTDFPPPTTPGASQNAPMASSQLSDAELMAAALEGASDGVVLLDGRQQDWPVLFVNAAFARLSGYTVQDVRGRACSFLHASDPHHEDMARLRAALRMGQEFSDELLCYRKDNSQFWAQVSVRPVAKLGNAPRYWVGTFADISKQRRLRESLQTSEARLELAMAASELAMWDWNLATGEVFYNDQWPQLIEAPAEELLLRESLAERLVLPENNPQLKHELDRLLAGETPKFEQEFELRMASGRTKWVSARAQVVRRDHDGTALRVIGVWRDVTLRRENSRTLDEANQRWERAVAGTSEGLFEWDLSTGYVWYAPRFRELLEYREQEFANNFTAFQKALHPDDRIAVLTRIRNHLEQRLPLDMSCRVTCGSGVHRWFRLRALAERDAAGRPKRLSGSIRDISSQVDAEQALHRSEDFYSTVLDALPVSVGYIDRNERIVYANRASHAFLGGHTTELRDQSLRDVVQPDLYAQLASHLSVAFNGKEVECQLQTRGAAGQQVDIDVSYVPHRNEQNEVQGCFLLARNVTARLQLEAELRQSQKMEAIGRLTGGVAHDFNNLLSVVIGNAQLLTRTLRESPRLYKQAETILRTAMRGAELTRRLLTFARQQSSTAQVVEVNELLNGIFDLVRRTLPGDIELNLNIDHAVGKSKIDPGQFENAVLNLVINARDAMPQGGAIEIATLTEAVVAQPFSDAAELLAPGDYVVVSVRDSGTGMSEEVRRRAFEPFFTTKDTGKGSGLGLPMVYGFVKGAGGHVHIDSAPDQGTSISMYFPCTREVAAVTAAVPAANAELPHGTETILVVDANADVRSTAVELLQSLGYRVLAAEDGRDALQLAATEAHVAMLFSDLMLPGGVSTNALLKQLRMRYPRLSVLLTSGFSDSVIANRAMLDGTIEIIAKPYQLNELARRVRAVLDQVEEPSRVHPR
jgi:PAS domain S-box-containing protein